MDEETGESYVTPREALRRRELYMLWLTRYTLDLLQIQMFVIGRGRSQNKNLYNSRLLIERPIELIQDLDITAIFLVFSLFTLQVLGGADHPVCVRILQGVWSGNYTMLASDWSVSSNPRLSLVRPSSMMTTSSPSWAQSAQCSIARVRPRCYFLQIKYQTGQS